MNDAGETRDDIKVPDNDLGKDIQTKFDSGSDYLVTLLKACGEESAIAVKAMAK